MRRRARFLTFLGIVSTVAMAVSIFSVAGSAHADPVSGAIFTTDSTGTEVNENKYAMKTDVYLNGGPGVNAPSGSAGLSPDGNYYFQVTNPSGKTLLSSDVVACREVHVGLSGYIDQYVDNSGKGCSTAPHVFVPVGTLNLGLPADEVTVQLFPFDDTNNPGGVYKAWMTPVLDYNEAGCAHLVWGFCSSDSKTDNFKVKSGIVVEVDTEFFDNAGNPIDGLMVTHTDTLGAKNIKWSEYDPAVLAYDQAHVEDVETGTHQITIANQVATSTTPACTITEIDTQFPGQNTIQVLSGPGTVSVPIPNNAYNNKTDQSYFINVYCA